LRDLISALDHKNDQLADSVIEHGRLARAARVALHQMQAWFKERGASIPALEQQVADALTVIEKIE
jgi:hypothetical protein